MRVVQEITEWDDNVPNHIYFLNDDKSKMFAYIRAGSNAVFKFSKPLGFDSRKRKFKEVVNTWGFEEEKPVNPTWQIVGSKGSTYTVEKTQTGYTCTCSGFKFRGHCKHIAAVETGQV